jgi:hypothetical protein
VAADGGISKEDFFPSVLEQFVYQGQLWGLPGNVTVNVMNYNKLDSGENEKLNMGRLLSRIGKSLSTGSNRRSSHAHSYCTQF